MGTLTGECFCGAVRYVVEAAPFHETICHCVDCRRAVGSVSVAWFSVPRASFRILGGTPTSFRSSALVTRRFCGTCGTSLTYEADSTPDELDIATATLDDPDAVPPKDQTETDRKVAWVRLEDGLPAYPQARRDGLR